METCDSAEQDLQKLQKRLEMRERQIEAVHRISAALFSLSDLDSILRETLHVALETVDAEAGSILLYSPERRRLVFRYVVGNATLVGQEIDPVEDLTGRAATVFRTGAPLITASVQKEGYNPRFDDATGFRTENIVTVALKTVGGESIGVMQAINKRDGAFGQDDLSLLEIVSSLAATSITNFRLAEEAQLAAVARAVGDLGHDIKNALTPIETMIETTADAFLTPLFEEIDALSPASCATIEEYQAKTLRALEPLREWQPEMLSAMRDGCGDIREMVSEIADYIKGAQATNMQLGDMGEVVQERLRRLKILARDRRVTLHLEDMGAAPQFAFDRRLTGRAVFNLVNNALNAINMAVKRGELDFRHSGYHIWVRLRFETEGVFPEGGYCHIEVEDDGPGIPEVILKSLFTAQTISATPGGTGIGTRFVKSVADAHRGEAGVVSEIGKGARFWLKLPLQQEITVK